MKIAIIGGTGTLGQALISELIKDRYNEILCISRCELKQKALREEYKGNDRIKFALGDIRDRDRMFWLLGGIDAVFLTAALKHIDVLEENPEESIKTNISGVINVADAAIANGVKVVSFSSTDKAVEAINVYGMCKGIAEKILLSRNQKQNRTTFSVFRWGNVAGSRGSIIPIFAKTLKEEGRAYITDESMTRFWLRIEDAVKFMLGRYTKPGLHIPPAKAAPVSMVIDSVARVIGIKAYSVVSIGLRAGEKIHEKLTPELSSEACTFTSPELDALVKAVIKGVA
jgi:UDP-N-acetylglucosamine 4,6-dehydratase/5-epimerase